MSHSLLPRIPPLPPSLHLSNSHMEGVLQPAVLAGPVLGTQTLRLEALPWGQGLRRGGPGSLLVVLVLLVEVAVIQAAGASTQVMTAAFVLLDGLVQGPELAQQRHVLLPQTHLGATTTS